MYENWKSSNIPLTFKLNETVILSNFVNVFCKNEVM